MSQPSPIDLVHELHIAVYGYSVARPESPEQVWNELLDRVRGMSRGMCAQCIRRDRAWSTAARVAGSKAP